MRKASKAIKEKEKQQKGGKKKALNGKIYEKHVATRVSPAGFSYVRERFNDAQMEAMKNVRFGGLIVAV